MKRLLSALLLCCFALPLYAQTDTVTGQASATISWENATQYEDGSALDPADIDSVVIFYGPTSREGRGCVERPTSETDTSCYPLSTSVPGDGTTAVIDIALDQPTTFYFAGVTVVDGAFSRYSSEASVAFDLVVEGKQPGPPTSLSIQMQVTCQISDTSKTCRFEVH